MPVTVLYPEERQIPDDGLEAEIFGPEVRLMRRSAKSLADLDPAGRRAAVSAVSSTTIAAESAKCAAFRLWWSAVTLGEGTRIAGFPAAAISKTEPPARETTRSAAARSGPRADVHASTR